MKTTFLIGAAFLAGSAAHAAQEPTRAAPKVPLHSLVTALDYPADAKQAGEQGTVSMRLDIGAEGRVTGCTILASSGSARLDSASCELLRRRASFTPARDGKGKAMPDVVETRLSWRLGESPYTIPGYDTANAAWLACLMPRVQADAAGTLAEAAIADRALAACTAEEQRVVAVLTAAPPGFKADSAATDVRTPIRTGLVQAVRTLRSRPQP